MSYFSLYFKILSKSTVQMFELNRPIKTENQLNCAFRKIQLF